MLEPSNLIALPDDILVELIVRSGPRLLEVCTRFYHAYLTDRAYIRACWLRQGLNVWPVTIDELKFLNKHKLTTYPAVVTLLATATDETIRYALEHDVIETSPHTLLRLVRRPELMTLVKLDYTNPSVLYYGLALELLEYSVELPDCALKQHLYQSFHVTDPDHHLHQASRLLQAVRCRSTDQVNREKYPGGLARRFSTDDLIWWLEHIGQLPVLFELTDDQVVDLLQRSIELKRRWDLYETEWYYVASVDLDLARQATTDYRLGPMATSLYHNRDEPKSVYLFSVPNQYHWLYVENWPKVEFYGVNDRAIAARYVSVWGRRYDTAYVRQHYRYDGTIAPKTPRTAVMVVQYLNFRVPFNWLELVYQSIKELVDHSPDGSYTSWFDRQYPTIGDGGAEHSFQYKGGWYVPNYEVMNGVPEHLPRTRTLVYLIEHTNEYIEFDMRYLNLPRSVFRLLRPRLTYFSQPFNDERLGEIVAHEAREFVFLKDTPGRFPPAQSSTRRSRLMYEKWIHVENLANLVIPAAKLDPLTDPALKQLCRLA